MNLHGFLAREGIQYGSEEALDFTDMYFMTVAYHAYRASHTLAVEHGTAFRGFADSAYANRPARAIISTSTPTAAAPSPRAPNSCAPVRAFRRRDPDRGRLGRAARRHPARRHLQPEPAGRAAHRLDLVHQPFHLVDPPDRLQDRDPQGRQARARLLPGRLHDQREPRILQGRLRNRLEAIVDTYAEATQHVDQGLSLTLFFPTPPPPATSTRPRSTPGARASRPSTTSASASRRWKGPRCKAASPARSEESVDDVCVYRLSSALDVPSYAFGLRRRSPHTSSTNSAPQPCARPQLKEPTCRQ